MLSSRMCKSETILNKITLTTEVDRYLLFPSNKQIFIYIIVSKLKDRKLSFLLTFFNI